MLKLGQMNHLRVLKQVEFGLYLDGGAEGEILLPRRQVPEGCTPGQELEVFIYRDSEDRLIATTTRPRAQVGEFALLKVAAVNRFGTFLDWGLDKDLLLPFNQQKHEMRVGSSALVYLYIDEKTQRIAASAKLDRFLDRSPARYRPGEQVELLIAEHTDLGYKAIVNQRHWGLLFDCEVFKALRYGQRITGYVKKVRAGEKIDLSLQPPGYAKVEGLAERILKQLQANQGFLALTDKSPPERIYQLFGCSKKAYKMAVGRLYKERRIRIEADGIHLLDART